LVIALSLTGHGTNLEFLKIDAGARLLSNVFMVASTIEGVPLEGLAAFEGAIEGLPKNETLSAEIKAIENESKAIARYWPQNDGFIGPREKITLPPGTIIDRYGGGPRSQYFSPAGTPFDARSIPSHMSNLPLRRFEVLQHLEVEAGQIAPAFGKLGLGRQYLTELELGELLERGLIRELGGE